MSKDPMEKYGHRNVPRGGAFPGAGIFKESGSKRQEGIHTLVSLAVRASFIAC